MSGSFKVGLFAHTCRDREDASAQQKKTGRRGAFESGRYHSIGRIRAEDVHRPMPAGLESERGQAEAKEVVVGSDLEAAAVPVRAVVVGHLVSAVLVLERHDCEHSSPGCLHRAYVVPRLSLAAAHLPRAALRATALHYRVLADAMPVPGVESNRQYT